MTQPTRPPLPPPTGSGGTLAGSSSPATVATALHCLLIATESSAHLPSQANPASLGWRRQAPPLPSPALGLAASLPPSPPPFNRGRDRHPRHRHAWPPFSATRGRRPTAGLPGTPPIRSEMHRYPRPHPRTLTPPRTLTSQSVSSSLFLLFLECL